MKYVRTKSNKILTTTDNGHHKDLAKASEVRSAGRFSRKNGKVITYSKSYGFNAYPKKEDAALIEKQHGTSRR